MTPHQKAIEAAARAMACADEDEFTDADWGAGGNIKDMYMEEAKIAWEAGLVSARESGWELKTKNLPYEPITDAPEYNAQQALAQLIWRNMFDAAPRFEDAP